MSSRDPKYGGGGGGDAAAVIDVPDSDIRDESLDQAASPESSPRDPDYSGEGGPGSGSIPVADLGDREVGPADPQTFSNRDPVYSGEGGGAGSTYPPYSDDWLGEAQFWQAKGDLAVGVADNDADVLPVGPDGYVLWVDSASPTGLSWKPPTGATGPPGPPGPQGPPGGVSYSQFIGDGASQAFVVTHNIGTKDVQVDVYRRVAPFDRVEADVERTSVNSVTIRTTVIPDIDEFVVAVSGPGSAGGGSGGGGDLHYTHNQGALAAVWTVNHNLGKYPTVAVVDSGDSVLIPDVHYVDLNSLTVNFEAATSGKVVCN